MAQTFGKCGQWNNLQEDASKLACMTSRDSRLLHAAFDVVSNATRLLKRSVYCVHLIPKPLIYTYITAPTCVLLRQSIWFICLFAPINGKTEIPHPLCS